MKLGVFLTKPRHQDKVQQMTNLDPTPHFHQFWVTAKAEGAGCLTESCGQKPVESPTEPKRRKDAEIKLELSGSQLSLSLTDRDSEVANSD